FQRFAARFPLTRGIARRRARALFDLCAGFVYSQVLLACVRLALFEILARGPATAAELSGRVGLAVPALTRLLEAAVALDLLERRGADAYGLGPLGVLLVGQPGLTALIEHHALVYPDLADPVRLLCEPVPQTRLAGYWPYAHVDAPAALGAADTDPYTTLMARSQQRLSEEVLDAVSLRGCARLLDVGGGDGAFAEAALRRSPGLEAVVFDLPPVAARASARFAAAGLAGRAQAVGGDFLRDPLPSGADLVSLVRILHDHDDPQAARLLAAVRAALAPGGRLLIVEPLAGHGGSGVVGSAYLSFYLLALGRGRIRSQEQVAVLLARAGFRAPVAVATRHPLPTGVLLAHAG
ncbi:MAG: methyltransferase domain-containing protein, partial [Proteobacteria bacterium]|nr:methyltransferase domain-containing protein [Pseudomonadota bacterium]